MTQQQPHALATSDPRALVRARLVNEVVCFVRADELAVQCGYEGANSGFRKWCREYGTAHVPGRPGIFDLKAVRSRLDVIQGLQEMLPQSAEEPTVSLVEQRRQRRAFS